MCKKKTAGKLVTICSVLLVLGVLFAPRMAMADESWDDLFEEDHEFFGSEKEEKMPINAFFVEKESWEGHESFMFFWLLKSTDYPRYESFRFLPFYYGLQSKIDERRKTIWFLPPFYYGIHTAEYDKTITSVGYSYTSKTENEFSALYLWYHSSNSATNERSRALFPLFRYYADDPSGEKSPGSERSLLTPLFYVSFYGDDEKRDNMDIISPLLFSNVRDQSEENSEGFFMVPLLAYRSWDNDAGKSHTNLALIFDWASSRKGLRRVTSPLLWWEKNDYFVLLPFIYNFWEGDAYSINNPFYFSHKTRSHESLGIPFVPIVWYSDTNTRSGEETKSLMSLLVWENNGEGETTGIWNPLFLHRDNSYTHIPLLLTYWNYEHDETAFINPLWFKFENPESSYFGFPILPFLWYSYDGADYSRRTVLGMFSWKTGQGNEPSSGFGPGYYYERSENYSRTLIGPWYHYETADETKSSTFLFPLYYSYENTKKNHSISFSPLHYSRQQGDDSRFWCLLWYSDEKPSEQYDRWTFIPFYYSYENKKDDYSLSFSPIHYSREKGEDDRFWLLLYYSDEQPSKQYDMWTFVPFYYTRTTPKSTLSMSPLALRYTDHKRGKYYYVNLALIARSVSSGPFKPVTDVGVGKIDDTWHVDFNLSWMYSVFEYYQRVPLRNPFTAEDIRGASADDIAQSEDSLSEEELAARLQDIDSYPQLQDEREDNKELALKYWGWSVLFGMLAYEQVEDETHFRWLPLCWLTWNEKSADKLNYIFAWKLDYENRYNDEEYYAFFPVFLPIYGKHRRGESFQQAFVLNAFWREYDAETHEWEYTVLWPLINWYHGDTRYGSRVVPFYWHKHYLENEDSEHDWLIGLPFFRHEQKVTGKEYSYSLTSINPLWFHRQTEDDKSYARMEWYPILPVYFEKETAGPQGYYRGSRVLYSLYSHVQEEDLAVRSDNTNILFGLYHDGSDWLKTSGNTSSRKKDVAVSSGQTDEGGWQLQNHDFWVVPFWYDLNNYSMDVHSRQRIVFPLGVLSSRSSTGTYRWSDEYLFTWLYGSRVYSSERALDTFRWFPVLPVAGVYHSGTQEDPDAYNTIHYAFPFFMRQEKNHNLRRYGVLGPLFWHTTKGREGGVAVSDYDIMWPIINWGTRTKPEENLTVDYWRIFPLAWRDIRETDSHRDSNLIMPLLLTFYESTQNKLDQSENTDFISPLGYYTSGSGDGVERTQFWFPIIPLVYHDYRGDLVLRKESYTNIMGLIAWWGNGETTNHWRVAPLAFKHQSLKENTDKGYFGMFAGLFWHGWNNDYSNWLVGPFWTSGNSAKKWRKTFLVPLAFYSNKGEGDQASGFFNMLGIFHHSWDPGKSTHWYGPWYSHSNSKKDTVTRNLVPLFFYSNNGEEDGESGYFNMLGIFHHSWEPGQSTHWYGPWYSHSNSEDQTVTRNLVPLVFYSNDVNGGNEKGYFNVLGMFYHSWAPGKSTNWYGLYYSQTNDKKDYSSRHILPLYYSWTEKNWTGNYCVPFWFYSNSRKKDYDNGFFNLLGPVYAQGWGRGKQSRMVLGSYWHFKNERKSRENLHVMPVYFSWQNAEEESGFRFGYYYKHRQDYHRRNFMYLYDSIESIENGREKYQLDFLLGMSSYREWEHKTRYDLGYGLVFDYYGDKTSDDYRLSAGWFLYRQRRHDDLFRSSVFPVYWHEHDNEESTWYVFPALSYSYMSEDEKFQLGLLGLAWYRNQDPDELSDSKYLLGGLLYGEKKVAERGYHSQGSLWGLLWQYETESETDFSKFSVMKFVYKRVRLDGVVSHRILGVKVSESPAD